MKHPDPSNLIRQWAKCLACLLFGTALIFGCKAGPPPPPVRHAEGVSARTKPYLASVNREPFHRPTCKWAKKIHDRNLIGYMTPEDAIADNHRPCQVCRP